MVEKAKREGLELNTRKKLLEFLRDNDGHYQYGDVDTFLEQDTTSFGELGSKLHDRSKQYVYDSILSHLACTTAHGR